jgi:hypothetical protein
MVWIKNCQDDDWINLDNVFSISFQQMDAAGKEDWIEFIVRPSNARILQICLCVGPNPNPNDENDITWHGLFYDRALEVTKIVFQAIAKAKKEDSLWLDLEKEILIKSRKDDIGKI